MRAVRDDDRVLLAGRLARVLEPVGVALAGRGSAADRCARLGQLDARGRAVVEQHRQAALRAAGACGGRNAGRPARSPRDRGGRSSSRRTGTCPRGSPAPLLRDQRADLRPDEIGEPVHAAPSGTRRARASASRARARRAERAPRASAASPSPLARRVRDRLRPSPVPTTAASAMRAIVGAPARAS